MRSVKQDLVGFRWSAFFEPCLPFTRVPVKLPSSSFPPPLCFTLPPPFLPPLSSSVHIVSLLAMVTPSLPAPFSPPPPLVSHLLTSVFCYTRWTAPPSSLPPTLPSVFHSPLPRRKSLKAFPALVKLGGDPFPP